MTKKSNSDQHRGRFNYFDYLADINYLARRGIGSVKEIGQLPHSHYLAHMKHTVTADLQQSEEGREILDKFNRYMNPRTDADLGAIRQLSGYQRKK